MAPAVGFLPPTWEPWIDFLALGTKPSPDLAKFRPRPNPGRHLGSEPVDNNSLSPLKYKQTNRYFKKPKPKNKNKKNPGRTA